MKALALLWLLAMLWLGGGVAWEVKARTGDAPASAPFYICHLR